MDFLITGEKYGASFYDEVIVTRFSSFMKYYGYADIKPEDFFKNIYSWIVNLVLCMIGGILTMKVMMNIVTMII